MIKPLTKAKLLVKYWHQMTLKMLVKVHLTMICLERLQGLVIKALTFRKECRY